MSTKLRILLSSLPDRDSLVAELWLENEQVAELRKEQEEIRVQLFAPTSTRCWDFSYPALLEALRKARSELEK